MRPIKFMVFDTASIGEAGRKMLLDLKKNGLVSVVEHKGNIAVARFTVNHGASSLFRKYVKEAIEAK